MNYVYRDVERLPKQLNSGIIYHSEEFEVAALLCACGCGHRVTLLVPDSHQLSSEGGMATVRPSIAVCDAQCKSHYYITAGRVEWLSAFSNATAASVMRRQIERHAALDVKLPSSWLGRIWAGIVMVYGRLSSLIPLRSRPHDPNGR